MDKYFETSFFLKRGQVFWNGGSNQLVSEIVDHFYFVLWIDFHNLGQRKFHVSCIQNSRTSSVTNFSLFCRFCWWARTWWCKWHRKRALALGCLDLRNLKIWRLHVWEAIPRSRNRQEGFKTRATFGNLQSSYAWESPKAQNLTNDPSPLIT